MSAEPISAANPADWWLTLNVRQRKMKWVIIILIVLGATGIVAAVTGVQQLHYSNAGLTIVHHTLFTRVLSLVVAVTSLVGAWGCVKRKIYGWYVVAAFLWISLLWAAFRAVHLAFTIDLPLAGILLGAIGEAFKIAIWAWLLFSFWAKWRKEFKMPNQPPEQTPPSRAAHL